MHMKSIMTRNNPFPNKMQGITAVEFAIVGSLFFMLLFAILEISRLMYLLNSLDNVTRATARLASVCDVTEQAEFKTLAMDNMSIGDLTTDQIQVQYLDDEFTAVDAINQKIDIQYVQASIQNYDIRLIIPFVGFTVSAPPFQVTIRSESLGIVPQSAGDKVSCAS